MNYIGFRYERNAWLVYALSDSAITMTVVPAVTTIFLRIVGPNTEDLKLAVETIARSLDAAIGLIIGAGGLGGG
jgi:hypothetical protein